MARGSQRHATKGQAYNLVSQSAWNQIQYNYSDSTLFDRIDYFFGNRYRAKQFNGVALFAKDGQIVFHKAFGFSNFNTNDSLQTDDAFQLASVSKPITAIAILRMVEDSLIHLEQTVQDFIPDFPYQNIGFPYRNGHFPN